MKNYIVLLAVLLFCWSAVAATYPQNCAADGAHTEVYNTALNQWSCVSISAGANPATPVQSFQYAATTSSFGGATGLYYSTTRKGIDFLANTTTANVISLGDNGTDTTSLAIGPSALVSVTTTNLKNVAVGSGTLKAITTGNNNVAVGSNTMTLSTVDTGNTAVGSNITFFNGTVNATALGSTITIQNNPGGDIAIGAGAEILSGFGNQIAIGSAITGGSNNLAIGAASLVNTNGNLIFGGAQAGNNSISIGKNVFKGNQGTAGQNLVGIGTNVGGALGQGDNSVLIGTNVANSRFGSGTNVVFIGASVDAALSNTASAVSIGENTRAGSGDTSIGIGALGAATTNNMDAVAIGYSALTLLTTGVHNNAVGFQSGALLTTGTGNICLGWEACDSVLTIGNNNIVIGNALDVSTSNTSNTALLGGAGIQTVLGTNVADASVTLTVNSGSSAGTIQMDSSNTVGTMFTLNNTAAGGHNWSFASDANASSSAGGITFADNTVAFTPWSFNNNVWAGITQVVYGWSAATRFVNLTLDTGISRDSAAVIDFGNGTQGNKSATLNAGSVVLTATIKTGGYTISALPSSTTGARAYVTDQLTSCVAAGAVLTGGGSVVCPVFYNGSAWVGD